MAAQKLKTKDIWELLAVRAEIDAAIDAKRREMKISLTGGRSSRPKRRSSPTNVRTVPRERRKPARGKKPIGGRRTARAA